MKPREYCCCAIPLINAGIYVTLTEQFILTLLVGILALATPSIVGASTPSFASVILAVISFVVCAIQVLGFIGVSREKPILYRRYVTLHGLAISAAFAVSAAWIIMSATRHSNAKTKCINDFFSGDLSDSAEGDTLCNIFPWADVGIMGGLWVVLAFFHAYLFYILSSYSASQQRDHDKYDQLNDSTRPLTDENIPMNSRNDPWDSRRSIEFDTAPRNDRDYKHLRQISSVSASDVMNQPSQQPKDSLSYSDYDYPNQPNLQPVQPSFAYTQDPEPTPQFNNYSDGSSRVERPAQTQAHPGALNPHHYHFVKKTHVFSV
ncbi:hypothetical protein BDQ17DRAFT_1294961 [Cyathus striatus]|nr:hypothetical protein BDQ17DRAFT_1294961 [Cyathus striatus]